MCLLYTLSSIHRNILNMTSQCAVVKRSSDNALCSAYSASQSTLAQLQIAATTLVIILYTHTLCDHEVDIMNLHYFVYVHTQVAAHYLYRLVDQHKRFTAGLTEFTVSVQDHIYIVNNTIKVFVLYFSVLLIML
jgi:hypothetical protein